MGESSSSPKSAYLWCLSRYNIQTESSLGNFSDPLGALVSGEMRYNRLVDSDFAGYFYREEHNSGLLGQLWVHKKILMETRRMLRNLLRKDKHTSELFREAKGLLDPEWAHPLAVKLTRAYF